MSLRNWITRERLPSQNRNLAGLHVVLWAMVKKQLQLMVRYRVNFLIKFVSMYIFFATIFFGGQAFVSGIEDGTSAISSTFEGIIVGWFLWTMAQTAYGSLQTSITSESRMGTLEHLYISPYGFGIVMGMKSVVSVLLSILFGSVLLISMMATTGIWLTIDAITVAIIYTFTIISALGLGFAIGGLALIYKKIDSVNNIINFSLIGLIGAPVVDAGVLHLLPLVTGSDMLQEAMREGVSIFEFTITDIFLLVGTGIGYLLLGYTIFRYSSTVARRRGVMGHY